MLARQIQVAPEKEKKGTTVAETHDALWALGLMSGTSMDGVDAAMLRTDGMEILGLGPALAVARPAGEAVRRVAGAWRDHRKATDEAARATLAESEAAVLDDHAAAVMAVLAEPAQDGGPMPDLVGFHGQTVGHAPEEGWTWQLGDGAALARRLARTVVWDFRSADIAAGGQGAPLAPFYHWALARHLGLTAPVAFVNIGGVANVTWVDPAAPAPEAPGALMAFDTGPGNALIDDLVRARTGRAYDAGGALAAAGRADPRALQSNALADYLARPGPKSLDRNAFQQIREGVAALATEDAAATLAEVTAASIAAAEAHLPRRPERWIVCGGGRRNADLMRRLGDRLAASVDPIEAVCGSTIDGDMLEAQAFAYLAVRVLRGLPTSAPGTTGCRAPVSGGRVSRP